MIFNFFFFAPSRRACFLFFLLHHNCVSDYKIEFQVYIGRISAHLAHYFQGKVCFRKVSWFSCIFLFFFVKLDILLRSRLSPNLHRCIQLLCILHSPDSFIGHLTNLDLHTSIFFFSICFSCDNKVEILWTNTVPSTLQPVHNI